MVWAGFQTRDVGIGPRFPLVGNLQAFGLGHLGFPRILPLQAKAGSKLGELAAVQTHIWNSCKHFLLAIMACKSAKENTGK